MTTRFKRVISHLYIALMTASIILTLSDVAYIFTVFMTYFAMRVSANLIEKEENKYAKVQSRSHR